ncbi:MAG: NUDIX domain-containing protein, partial [Chloroflexota bacterium]
MPRIDDPGADRAISDFIDGVPDWLGPVLRFCSRCGGKLVFGQVDGEDRARHHCTECGYVSYVNPRLVVSTLPVTEAGELVLLRRGIPPGYGAWAQPGGFLEADETAIQGAVRETLEETRLSVELTHIVGVYSRPLAAVVVVAYGASIVAGQMSPTSEALEVRAFAVEDIPWAGLAFNTTLWAIRDWARSVRPDLDVDALG